MKENIINMGPKNIQQGEDDQENVAELFVGLRFRFTNLISLSQSE